MNNVNEMLGTITEFLKSEAKTETIIGQQFKLGDYTCVPVMSIGVGFGGGGGEAHDGSKAPGVGTGAGAGMGLGPVGFLVTRGEEIQFIPTRTSKGLDATLEKIPDLVDKLFSRKKEDSPKK